MSKLWEEAKALFFKLNDIPESEHEKFIEIHTKHSPELKALVLELLTGDKKDGKNILITEVVSEEAKMLLQQSYMAESGTRFDNYEITETLGAGGMGQVYLAKRVDQQFNQLVAIKVIHSRHLMSETIKRFRQERQILASLKHPNIAQLIGGGETDSGLPYIVMEYVEGINIVEYCRKHQLSVEQRIQLFEQVLHAIQYAHQNLVIHRDLKPSNVMVTEQGIVKLLDFGIAKLLDSNVMVDDPYLTQIEMKVLTPLNASPEQVKQENATTRTDIYGLCSLLYHMLTEQPIFSADNASSSEIESWILEKIPAKPSENIAKDYSLRDKKAGSILSGDLDTIILKGLQKEPERRYSSVEQLQDDLHRYQNFYPILAKPDSKLYIAKKFFQRNRAASILGGLFTLFIVAFVATVIYQANLVTQQRDIALREAENARHISTFLIDTFDSANPNIVGDTVLTPKNLVDNAVNRVERLNIEPILRGQLPLTLFDVYWVIGESDWPNSLLNKLKSALTKHLTYPKYMHLNCKKKSRC